MFDIQRVHVKEPHTPVARLILAHGAGAGMEHEFMQQLAAALAANGIEVILFNFPYMQTMKAEDKRRPPNKAPVLMSHFSELVAQIGSESPALPTLIGGKSMGGRIATMVANDTDCVGVIAFGYPFHPPGKPEKTRTSHLPELKVPLCVIQGERDTFGTQQDVESYTFNDSTTCHFLADGDHSFKPRKASGYTQQQHIDEAAALSAAFVQRSVV
ncbi:alpha/beta family hydrolase [Alteromonas halophila]|uniref:Alpha/beta hydrolase n=1 Tax=Alteromonas halophila TaxID=516698 RepID=A0A918JFB1_9ALTE|nr:alpha/beta family hydrolase [Alteromonas halophila]GGW76034.1 alpha/beta hydrolase [Alteromonas halophila]